MISAREAVALYEQSQKNIDRMLSEIEKKIIIAAEGGNRSVLLQYPDEFRVEIKHGRAELNPVQLLLKKNIEGMGYGFKVVDEPCKVLTSLDEYEDSVTPTIKISF